LSASSPSNSATACPIIDPADLIGRSFLKDQDNGECHCVHIVQLVKDHLNKAEGNLDHIKYLCKINEGNREELIAYNEILNYLENQEHDDLLWNFRCIVSHKGPLTREHPDYNRLSYNVKFKWENGEIRLIVIATNDLVTCAISARENALLDLPGWKHFKSIAKQEKKYIRMVNQAKLRSYSSAKQYKYGFEVPRNYEDAVCIDHQNANTKWQDAVRMELESVHSYNVFIDKGPTVPAGYRKIHVHLVFDVKHDG
jgi:hypothetical protein